VDFPKISFVSLYYAIEQFYFDLLELASSLIWRKE
jgi:hypothetical protein